MALRTIAIGALSMSSVTVVRLLSQIFVLPVLSRYLSPEDYGIVAIAMPVVFFGMIFTDAGMSQSLIRAKQYDHREWSSCFWLMVAIGLALCFLLFGLGYLISLFMHEPALFPIIAALSSVLVLQSITTVPAVSLQQKNRFTTLAGAEMMAVIVSLISALLAALAGWGAWALVVQQISLYLTKLVATFFVTRFVPLFEFHKHFLTHHIHFGRNMMGSSVIDLVRGVIINMLFGKVLGTSAVGYFSMGQMIADLPRRLSSGPVSMVLYPRFSTLVDAPEKLRFLFLFATRVLAFLLIPLIGMLAIAHEPVFTIFLSDKWAVVGEVFVLLAPGALVWSVTGGLRQVLFMALKKTDLILRFAAEMVVLQLVVLMGTIWFGLHWAVAGMSLTVLLYTARPLGQALRLIDLPLKTYLAVFIVPFANLIFFGGLYWAGVYFFSWMDWEKFWAAFILGAACLGSNVVFSRKTLMDEVRRAREYMV